MHSILKKRTYLAMYRLLDRVSPVDYDCGRLCGSICCTIGNEDILLQDQTDVQPEDADLGIYLYPGEDLVFTKEEDWLSFETDRAESYDFPRSWKGDVYFVRCLKAPDCDRPKRPLQCRLYPAAPHILEDGRLVLIRSDQEVPYTCPLISEEVPLNERFLKATHTVCRHLMRDPRIRDLFINDSLWRRTDPDFDEERAVIYPAT